MIGNVTVRIVPKDSSIDKGWSNFYSKLESQGKKTSIFYDTLSKMRVLIREKGSEVVYSNVNNLLSNELKEEYSKYRNFFLKLGPELQARVLTLVVATSNI
jgi:hypothetical protein